MKRFLGLLLTLTMLLTMVVPMGAFASDPSVAITTLTEGESYSLGSNIVLGVETDAADIKNIDFYANNEKIPGTILSDAETLIWYAPAEGGYAVKAVINFVSGAPVESTPVNIKVVSNNKVIASVDSTEGFADWLNEGKTSTSADYAYLGKNSLYVSSFKNNATSADMDVMYRPAAMPNTDGYSKLNVSIYSTGEVQPTYRITAKIDSDSAAIFKSDLQMKAGWNVVSADIPDKYNNKEIVYLTISNYGYGLDNSALDLSKCSFYINGIWLSNDEPVSVTATPSIPDGKTNVCNALTKYRVKFSEDLKTNPTMKITGGSLTDEQYTVAYDNGSAIAAISEDALAFNTTYTVTLGEAYTKYGTKFAGATYTFTTIADNCTNAEPVPSVVYPADGSTASTTTSLAAKVIFSDNVSKVEFYEGETNLGEAKAYTDGEYRLASASLTAGSHTIKAVITKTDTTTVESAPVTFTVGNTAAHKIHGIRNGDRIVINSDIASARKIAVVDSDTADNYLTEIPDATGVSKAVFLVDGVKAGEDSAAPYEFTIPTNVSSVGNHTLTVQVYTAYGMTPYTYTYTTLLGSSSETQKYSENWDVADTAAASTKNDVLAGTKTKIASCDQLSSAKIENGKLKLHVERNLNENTMITVNPIYLDGGYSGELSVGETGILSVSYEFTKSVNNVFFQSLTKDRGGSVLSAVSGNYSFRASHNGGNNVPTLTANKPYKVETVFDYGSNKFVTFLDGIEYLSGSMNDHNNDDAVVFLDARTWEGAGDIYIDNFKMETYNTANAADIKTYKIRGIENGDRIIASEANKYMVGIEDSDAPVGNVDGTQGKTTFIAPTNIKSVTFKVNGETVRTVNEAPFAIEVPAIKIGENNLVAEVTDIFNVKSTITKSYEVIYGDFAAGEEHDFEPVGGEPAAKPGTTGTSVKYAYEVVDGSTMLVATYKNGESLSENLDSYRKLGTADIAYVDFDFWTAQRYSSVQLQLNGSVTMLSIPHTERGVNNTFGYRDNGGTANSPNGKWQYHLGFLMDYAKKQFITYIDGVEYCRGTIKDDYVNARVPQIKISSNSYSDSKVYIDNYRAIAYNTVTNQVVRDAENEIEFKNVSSNPTANVMIANTTSAETKVDVYCAVYTAEDEFVSATVKPLTLKANEIKKFSKEVSAAAGNTVRIFVWGNATLKPIERK